MPVREHLCEKGMRPITRLNGRPAQQKLANRRLNSLRQHVDLLAVAEIDDINVLWIKP